MTVAALSAVQLSALGSRWWIVLLVTSAGGVVTLLVSLWVAKRAFPSAPFEHFLVLYGSATGTLPVGMALLRTVDPELRSPAPMSAVIGSAGAIIGGAPVVLFLYPIPIVAWPDNYPAAGWVALGLCAAWLCLLVVGWRYVGGLRPLRPLMSFWPPDNPSS